MNLQNSLTWFAVSLALLAIGLPYMSSNHIFQLLLGRKPQTDEDNLVARRFMIMIGAIGFAGVIFFFAFIVINFTLPMADWITQIMKLKPSDVPLGWIRVLCGLLIFGVIAWFIYWLWGRTKESVEVNPNDTSDIGSLTASVKQLTTSINNLSNKIDTMITKQDEMSDKLAKLEKPKVITKPHSTKNKGK